MSGRGEPIISRRLAAILVIVSAVSLISAVGLYAFAPELRGEQSSQADVLSKSAVGYAGIRAIIDKLHYNTRLGREAPDMSEVSLEVLTPEPYSSPSELAKAARPGPSLIILPKWIAMGDPQHTGWVLVFGAYGDGIAGLFDKIAHGAKLHIDKTKRKVRLKAAETSLEPAIPARALEIDQIQTLSGKMFDPEVVDDRGRAVLARIKGTDIHVLSEPDLVNNLALRDTDVTRFAVAAVTHYRHDDNPIQFDITLNGYHRSPDLLRAVFSPPFLGAALCALLAAMFMAYHGFTRFGPARQSGRAIAFGKQALADNTAAVIKLMHREPRMAPRYAQAMLNAVIATLGMERAGDPARVVAGLEKRNSESARFADLAAEAAQVHDTSGLLRISAKLYDWRRGILNERG